MDPLAQQATRAALNADWPNAIKLNEQILHSHPDDIAAHLRIANALLETGKSKEAKKHATAALSLDVTNRLAKKCLEKCLTGSVSVRSGKGKTNLKAFIEVPGKTHIIKLNQIGEPKLLSSLRSGDVVTFGGSSHKMTIETETGNYLGKLPDDVAAKLASKKATLWAAIKSVDPTQVVVLVHEL